MCGYNRFLLPAKDYMPVIEEPVFTCFSGWHNGTNVDPMTAVVCPQNLDLQSLLSHQSVLFLYRRVPSGRHRSAIER